MYDWEYVLFHLNYFIRKLFEFHYLNCLFIVVQMALEKPNHAEPTFRKCKEPTYVEIPLLFT